MKFIDVLTVDINPKSIKSLLRYVKDRLGGKPIEMEVEADGRKIKVEASSREELEAAIKAAKISLQEIFPLGTKVGCACYLIKSQQTELSLLGTVFYA